MIFPRYRNFETFVWKVMKLFMVCGRAETVKRWLKRLTEDAFWGIMKLSGAKMIKNHADFPRSVQRQYWH